MIEFLESIFTQIDPGTAYLILAFSAFTENVVPPIPGDTVVVLGAYLVSTGRLEFWGVYISTTLGSVSGFVMMYLMAIRFGRSFIYTKYRSKIFKEEHIHKVELWFSRWGYWVIFANRFLSGTRSVISVFAGLFHLHPFLVILLSFISAAIWNSLLIVAGILVGENWPIIMDIVSRYNQVLIALTVAVISFILLRRYRRKKSKSELN